MILYMIKRKRDGKFLRKINGYYMLTRGVSAERANEWSQKPAYMLRTPDGILGNLRKLCSEPYWHTEAPDGVCDAVAAGWRVLGWRNFCASRLHAFEIVKMNVDIVSAESLDCSDFAQVEKIASAPVNQWECQQ